MASIRPHLRSTMRLVILALSMPGSSFGYQAVYSAGFANRAIGRRRVSCRRQSIHHARNGPRQLFPVNSSKSSEKIAVSNRPCRISATADVCGQGCTSALRVRVTAAIHMAQQYIARTTVRVHEGIKAASQTLLPLAFSLALILSLPMNSWAEGRNLLQSSTSQESPSSSYYLQNDPQHKPSQTQGVVSVQTQRSEGNEYKFVKRRSSRQREGKRKQSVKRISLFVMLATFAASSFRASLRKARVVRSASPFGRIRNVSPLGNGVSVIRVCVALGFDDEDAGSLLKKLQLEEAELYSTMTLLAQPQMMQGGDAYNLKQQALGKYLSNVASTFLQYTNAMRYGSIDSVRVPFVEEAVTEFRRTASEERGVFDGQRLKQQQLAKQDQPKQSPKRYVLATILLAIKGDHTSVPLPFGIIRQRDMARALARIASDAEVEGCLVGSEVLIIPDKPAGGWLTEKGIMQSFPDLVPLT